MAVTLLDADETLPRSHCFVSVAHGRRIRSFKLSTRAVWSVTAALGFLLVWLLASSAYLLFHDDLVSALMAREVRMQYAYEDRIAALRGQVQHEASLALVGSTTLDGRVRDLALRASTLETRASLVADLAEKVGLARTTRVRTPALARAEDSGPREAVDNPIDEVTGSLAPRAETSPSTSPATRKPRPEATLLPADGGDRDEPSLKIRLASIDEALEHVDAAQYNRLAAIGGAARRQAEAIRGAFTSAGIAPERFKAKAEDAATGGPYVPLAPEIGASPFGHALEALQADIASAASLTRALPRLPFAKPLTGAMEVTSPFGARLDPFLGRPAMHTGVDLREEYGTQVQVTAAGRVVSAGPDGGYGVMVEVDHGHGLTTRYAHLSAVAVAPGQSVAKGDVIGEVGATGRATGPHLHYETRIDGEPVDPMRFLLAGERLAAGDIQP